MKIDRFLAELKRRKVYSVAVSYAVGGWLLVQIATQTFPFLDIPNWATRLVIVLVAAGFPIVLVLAWIYDFTRHGLKRTEDVDLPRGLETPRQSRGEKSIAVLPFADAGGALERDYLGDGIAEEILSALARIEGLRVAARRSSFWFKDRQADLREIADCLNVDHVLEGTVRREGNRVRVTAELISARDGFTIWSERFDREMHDIFALQDEITRATVDALKLKLAITPPLPARSPEAYDAYLHGLFHVDKPAEDELRRSLAFFRRALNEDPQFARAWTGIAKAWLWLADAYVPPLEGYREILAAAESAIKIDNQDAEAHVYRAESKRVLEWDLAGAEADFLRACELEPNSTPSNYFIAALYAARGEREKALAYLGRTSRIDPASLWVNNFASELYRYFGLHDQARAAGERALQLDPTFAYGEPLLAALYRETGKFDDAIALYKNAQSISGRAPFGLAITYAMLGRRDEALQTLHAVTSARRYTPGDGTAHIFVALGDYDRAVDELQRALREHSSSLHMVGIAPEFAPLRGDERFLSILKKIGLEPEKVFAASAA